MINDDVIVNYNPLVLAMQQFSSSEIKDQEDWNLLGHHIFHILQVKFLKKKVFHFYSSGTPNISVFQLSPISATCM